VDAVAQLQRRRIGNSLKLHRNGPSPVLLKRSIYEEWKRKIPMSSLYDFLLILIYNIYLMLLSVPERRNGVLCWDSYEKLSPYTKESDP
jgi:hypothetical protein